MKHVNTCFVLLISSFIAQFSHYRNFSLFPFLFFGFSITYKINKKKTEETTKNYEHTTESKSFNEQIPAVLTEIKPVCQQAGELKKMPTTAQIVFNYSFAPHDDGFF